MNRRDLCKAMLGLPAVLLVPELERRRNLFEAMRGLPPLTKENALQVIIDMAKVIDEQWVPRTNRWILVP